MENDPDRPPQLTGVAAVMFDAMSQVSEAAHGVRWAQGTEFGIWMLLTQPRTRWGAVRGDEPDVAPALTTIEALASQAHIWLTWPEGTYGPIEMALDNWRIHYATSVSALKRRLTP